MVAWFVPMIASAVASMASNAGGSGGEGGATGPAFNQPQIKEANYNTIDTTNPFGRMKRKMQPMPGQFGGNMYESGGY